MVTTLSKSEQEKMQANRINTVNKFEKKISFYIKFTKRIKKHL